MRVMIVTTNCTLGTCVAPLITNACDICTWKVQLKFTPSSSCSPAVLPNPVYQVSYRKKRKTGEGRPPRRLQSSASSTSSALDQRTRAYTTDSLGLEHAVISQNGARNLQVERICAAHQSTHNSNSQSTRITIIKLTKHHSRPPRTWQHSPTSHPAWVTQQHKTPSTPLTAYGPPCRRNESLEHQWDTVLAHYACTSRRWWLAPRYSRRG
jgi:hypothetical protein